jgi:hypothetical protein
MNHINIFFKNNDPIIIKLIDHPVGDKFFKLVKNNLEKEKPIFRDHAKYDEKYLKDLAFQLKKEFNWDWLKEDYSLENTVMMHKEIENLLEKDYSFKNIPGHLQNLIHEAHFCIHTIQYRDKNNIHGNFLQIEWFNDDFVELGKDLKFSTELSPGDIILQNPYVGHSPLQCYQQNDYKNIMRTCTFHDRIKSGIKINLVKSCDINLEKYKNWWYEKGLEFVSVHGFDKILHYTGFPVVGKVSNLETLKELLKTPVLELDKIVL